MKKKQSEFNALVDRVNAARVSSADAARKIRENPNYSDTYKKQLIEGFTRDDFKAISDVPAKVKAIVGEVNKRATDWNKSFDAGKPIFAEIGTLAALGGEFPEEFNRKIEQELSPSELAFVGESLSAKGLHRSAMAAQEAARRKTIPTVPNADCIDFACDPSTAAKASGSLGELAYDVNAACNTLSGALSANSGSGE